MNAEQEVGLIDQDFEGNNTRTNVIAKKQTTPNLCELAESTKS